MVRWVSVLVFADNHLFLLWNADDEKGPPSATVDQQRNRIIATAALKNAEPLAAQGEPSVFVLSYPGCVLYVLQYMRVHVYSCVCDVCREWVNEVGFFLYFPVWLVCYAHVF